MSCKYRKLWQAYSSMGYCDWRPSMFPDISKKTFCGLIGITLCTLVLQQNPAAAQAQQKQTQPCGYLRQEDGRLINVTQDDGRLISAQYSTPCARYYVPYAIMAAAVYLDVSKFEDNRAHRKLSDAELALTALGLGPQDTVTDYDKTVRDYAKTLLRGWSYQFGSEGYIDCLHNKDQAYPEDEACKAVIPNRIRRFLGSYRGPAFNVWAHRLRAARCTEVSIAFRGTTGFADYVSSGYRFTGWAVDTEYHQLQRNVDAIIGRITGLPCYRTETTQIVSVGHSLGAGLAELAAFAPRKDPRIAKVFAFNPSSESGHTLVDQTTLDKNVGSEAQRGSSLEVDIVYQPGEALEEVREIDQQFPLDKRCYPLVRTVRFDVSHERGLGAQHAIRGNGGFAYGIVETAKISERPLSAPPPVSSCPTRYHPPGPEEQVGPAEVYAPNGSLIRSARLNQQKASNLFLSAQSGDNTNWIWTGVRLVATPTTAKNGRRARIAHL
jgi:hypothetical protein